MNHLIPIPPYYNGWRQRRRIYRACRRMGGHFYHPEAVWGARCCNCGHHTEHPTMPLGALCIRDFDTDRVAVAFAAQAVGGYEG